MTLQDGVRRHDQREGSLDGRRVERGLRAQGGLNAQQRLPHRLDERQAPRGELHVPSDPDQQLVIEVFPQLLQRSAHGGLGHEHPLRGPRHVLLVQQRIEGNQQIEVEPVQLHVIRHLIVPVIDTSRIPDTSSPALPASLG